MADEPEDDLPPEGEETQAAAPPEDAEPEQQAQSPASDVEDLAREMGWSEQEKWRGDPAQWKDAKTFLRDTVSINRTQSRELKEMKATVDRMARTSAAIADRAIQEERDRLTREFNEAVDQGDANRAYLASESLRNVGRDIPAEPDEMVQFRERNPWFLQDAEAQAFAKAYADQLLSQGVGSPGEQISRVEEALKRRFPEHYQQQAEPRRERQPTPLVNTGNSRTARPAPRVKGAADLPPDARRAGEDFVRRGRVKDLAEYAKFYFEENA